MIFDSFDWMKGEPELIGVDSYPIYASDAYYQQHLYLNDALKESLRPVFWWQGDITLKNVGFLNIRYGCDLKLI
jgi:hypothetical protein